MTPAAGPDSTVLTARAHAVSADMMPPFACMMTSSRGTPLAASSFFRRVT